MPPSGAPPTVGEQGGEGGRVVRGSLYGSLVVGSRWCSRSAVALTLTQADGDAHRLHGVVRVAAEVPRRLDRLLVPASSRARQQRTCSPGCASSGTSSRARPSGSPPGRARRSARSCRRRRSPRRASIGAGPTRRGPRAVTSPGLDGPPARQELRDPGRHSRRAAASGHGRRLVRRSAARGRPACW